MPATSTYDVAVVGAGVFGAWTAYQLRRTGKRVVLIDAYGAGNSRSSSGDESRIMRMGYGADEIYTRSALRSLQLWQELFARVDRPLAIMTLTGVSNGRLVEKEQILSYGADGVWSRERPKKLAENLPSCPP